MPREMFGDVVNPSIRVGSQKWYTVPLSVFAHVMIFASSITMCFATGRIPYWPLSLP